VVAAAVDLRKLSSKLGIPWEPHVEASTIGGLVTETLERIPSVGDSIRWNGYRIEVLKADRHRVRLLSVRKDGD
jgi:CBS domain containing-hemolysin-like protein